MVSELDQFAGHEENSAVDVMFIVLMGHGGKINNEEFLKTADGKAFYLRDALQSVCDNKKYPHLIDKPKIAILQMCRGGK